MGKPTVDLHHAFSGYLHSPTICHGLVAEDLAKWPRPAEVCVFHYIHDILLTSDSLRVREGSAVVSPEVMWLAVNETKLKGPRLSVRFLGVIWLGKTKIIPDSVIDKMQAYPTPTIVKQLQTFWGLLGVLESICVSPCTGLSPLICFGEKGNKLGLNSDLGQAFQGSKHSIKCGQAFPALDPSRPCEVDTHVTQEDFEWGVSQQSEWLCQPLGFWSQLWKEQRCDTP